MVGLGQNPANRRDIAVLMKLLLPPNHKLSSLGQFVAYPIGKLLLRVLTLGKYPPEDEPHNALFVALAPYWIVGTLLTLIFS